MLKDVSVSEKKNMRFYIDRKNKILETRSKLKVKFKIGGQFLQLLTKKNIHGMYS